VLYQSHQQLFSVIINLWLYFDPFFAAVSAHNIKQVGLVRNVHIFSGRYVVKQESMCVAAHGMVQSCLCAVQFKGNMLLSVGC